MTLLTKVICSLLKWKCIQERNYAILAVVLWKWVILSIKFQPSHPGWSFHMGKFYVAMGWPRDLCRVPRFYSSVSNVKSFCVFFAAGQISSSFSPSPPIPLWLHGKYVVSILFFHCFHSVTVSRWLLLTGLSWIPYTLGLVSSQAPFPKLIHCWWV